MRRAPSDAPRWRWNYHMGKWTSWLVVPGEECWSLAIYEWTGAVTVV